MAAGKLAVKLEWRTKQMVEIINKYYQCECCGKQFNDKQLAIKHESEHIKLVGLKNASIKKMDY